MHVFMKQMLLSFLIVDQLMIYLLANYLFGEILPAVSSLMENNCPNTGDSWHWKWSLQILNYLIALQSLKAFLDMSNLRVFVC